MRAREKLVERAVEGGNMCVCLSVLKHARLPQRCSVCCNVLQCVVVRCGVWSCSQDHNTAGMLQRCSVLKYVAVSCSALQCVAISRSKNCHNVTALQCVLQHIYTYAYTHIYICISTSIAYAHPVESVKQMCTLMFTTSV